jgi:hypothetical protein
MVEAVPLHPILAVEIRADVRAPLSQPDLAGIIAILDVYPVGAFRHVRPVSDAQHVAFSRRFGPVSSA